MACNSRYLQDGKSIVDLNTLRGVAQLARALRSGRRGRRSSPATPISLFTVTFYH